MSSDFSTTDYVIIVGNCPATTAGSAANGEGIWGIAVILNHYLIGGGDIVGNCLGFGLICAIIIVDAIATISSLTLVSYLVIGLVLNSLDLDGSGRPEVACALGPVEIIRTNCRSI